MPIPQYRLIQIGHQSLQINAEMIMKIFTALLKYRDNVLFPVNCPECTEHTDFIKTKQSE
jgi:hypothetical protein